MPERGVSYCDGRATANTIETLHGGCSWSDSGSNSGDRTVKVFRDWPGLVAVRAGAEISSGNDG